MGTCPNCRTSSRADPDAFTLAEVLIAKPPGSFSLSGSTMKTVATPKLKLSCGRCGWAGYGYLEGDDVVIEWMELNGERWTARD